MKIITMAALREQIDQKKAAIGWIDDEASMDQLRNSGVSRTEAKRDSLARMAARANAAARRPVISNY